MRFTIDWLHLAELAAAVQGVMLIAALVAHRTNRTANRLLAALMASFTISLLAEVYYAAGLVPRAPHLFGVSYPMPWLYGPLVYLYAVAASDRTWRFGVRGTLHLVPALVVVLVTLPIYLLSGPEKVAMFARITAGHVPTIVLVLDPFKYVSGIAYSAATVLYLRAHRRRVEASYANTERVNLRWLQSLASVAAAIWLVAVVSGMAGFLTPSLERYGSQLVSLGVALFVYAIGYKGLRQPEVFRYDAEVSAPSAPEPAPEPELQPRYERSGLGEHESRQLRAALVALMTSERPHRDPDLTLPALAERLGSTPHKLSEVLNRELSQTFYDFVNAYRVDEVRARLVDPSAKHLNILALGLDAGFASKSTFNQAFKKITGQTPSAYRKELELGQV